MTTVHELSWIPNLIKPLEDGCFFDLAEVLLVTKITSNVFYVDNHYCTQSIFTIEFKRGSGKINIKTVDFEEFSNISHAREWIAFSDLPSRVHLEPIHEKLISSWKHFK